MSLLSEAKQDDRPASTAQPRSQGPMAVYHTYCRTRTWAPCVNLYESESHYCVVVELAGMTAGKIDLRLEKGELVLTGTRPTPPMLDETRPRHVHVMEIEHGVFCRSIKLPADVDDEGIEATYRGGYLYITLPRKA